MKISNINYSQSLKSNKKPIINKYHDNNLNYKLKQMKELNHELYYRITN